VNVSIIGVPVGGTAGVTEGGMNAQDDFRGAPMQLSVKFRAHPLEA
jgi:hypothetical protein